VHAAWAGPNRQFGAEYWVNEKSLTTDGRGEFALEGLAPGAEVRLKARHQEALTAQVTVVRPDPAKAVTLRVARGAGLELTGRAPGAGGGPVAGARVEVWARPWLPKPNVGTARAVALDGGVVLRTDAGGKFQTPRQLEPDGDYRVVVTAPGFQAESSGWLPV